jgi:hypothetical protein
MRYRPVIALLCLVPLAAQADALTETTGIVSQSVNSASGGSFSEVDLPAFNTALGQLTGVSIDITAVVDGSVTDYTGPVQPPSLVDAKVSLGFLSATPIAFASQDFTVQAFDNMARVAANFAGIFTPASFASFTEHGDNYFIPEPDIFIQALAGADTESITDIAFDITETFTYTKIPEPGSLALLAMAAFGCCAVGRFRSCRPAHRCAR